MRDIHNAYKMVNRSLEKHPGFPCSSPVLGPTKRRIMLKLLDIATITAKMTSIFKGLPSIRGRFLSEG